MAEPARPAGFDMNRLSAAQKLLLAVGLLLLIDFFLPWQRACSPDIPELGIQGTCVTATTGWSGVGVIAGLFLVAMLVWEALLAFGSNINLGNMSPAAIGAGLAAGAALFTLIRALTGLELAALGTWIGIVLALVLGYGAYMRFQEAGMAAGTAGPGRPTAPPPAP